MNTYVAPRFYRLLTAYRLLRANQKRNDMITFDNAVFRMWFCAGSIGPMLSLIHVNDAEGELSKRLEDDSQDSNTKLVVKN